MKRSKRIGIALFIIGIPILLVGLMLLSTKSTIAGTIVIALVLCGFWCGIALLRRAGTVFGREINYKKLDKEIEHPERYTPEAVLGRHRWMAWIGAIVTPIAVLLAIVLIIFAFDTGKINVGPMVFWMIIAFLTGGFSIWYKVLRKKKEKK